MFVIGTSAYYRPISKLFIDILHCNWKKICIIIQIKSDLLELFYLAFYIARYRWILWDLYFYFISWMTVIINMKPAQPWMLAHLKIIWQFHAHPVHQKVSRFLGPRYIGTIEEKKNLTLCKHRFPCNTLTHSINEDLLNIKRKGDPEVSYPFSYVRYHWNPEPGSMCIEP
jgi:hypothetical protein